ncbi:MAG TPA: hypothetical protein VLL97_08215 [Acidobacteriota bacterium]|nr:hypothetical protein [Acidobacteriota bacterium]
MRRLLTAAVMMALAVLTVSAPDGVFFAGAAAENHYEVLSPWADVDPIPVRGISPRLDTLKGKNIGLFANFKRAARPITDEVERRLKERYPTIRTSLFHSTLPNVDETETVNREKFEAWAKEMDAVVAAVGD